METKQKWWSMLLWHADSTGKKRGWAFYKYQERFKMRPNDLRDFTTPPDAEVANWIRSRAIAYAKRQRKVEDVHAAA